MTDTTQLLSLTTQITSAHCSHNVVTTEALPGLIREIYQTLVTISDPAAVKPPAADRPEPAVPIKRSVFPDYIVCLEDGKKLKMLKRYLQSSYTMTPDEYRARWGLPSDYPMVAPNYAARRSTLAKQIGLGRKANSADTSDAAESEDGAAVVQQIPERKRSRAKT